jgi:branched-chain amino acid transport system substrate-binding protein
VGDGSNSPELFKIAGPAAEGVIAFSNPTAEFLPDAKNFADAYQAEYGAAPGPYSTLSYDAMKLLAWAINTAGTTEAAQVIETLQGANFTESISGPISFTPEKTLARSNFVVLEGKGGAWTLAQ